MKNTEKRKMSSELKTERRKKIMIVRRSQQAVPTRMERAARLERGKEEAAMTKMKAGSSQIRERSEGEG